MNNFNKRVIVKNTRLNFAPSLDEQTFDMLPSFIVCKQDKNRYRAFNFIRLTAQIENVYTLPPFGVKAILHVLSCIY